jgi:hypothetical protein
MYVQERIPSLGRSSIAKIYIIHLVSLIDPTQTGSLILIISLLRIAAL